MNGRFEANGTFEYATGYVRRRESKLTLASPYRADSIGIELLCWERNKRSTDNKADNDIFFVALKKTGELYQTYMDIFLQEEGVKMFNAPYHPYFLALANRSLIAINAPKITFASTDMSSKTTISSGEHLFADIQTGQKLFEPVVYNFASGNFIDLPDAHRCNGLVRFNWQGVWLDGFIKKIAKNYSLETETTWELWKVK